MTTATAVRGKRVRHAETKQPHLSREQRVALGKAARAEVPAIEPCGVHACSAAT